MYLMLHLLTNFEEIMSIFGFLNILVPYAEIWPATEVQRLAAMIFPQAHKS